MSSQRCVMVFAKPSHPGRVKTRLLGELTPEEAAQLYTAFVGDLVERLSRGDFATRMAWDLEEGETPPLDLTPCALPGQRQRGRDLGERLFQALEEAAQAYPLVAAVGSDHPELSLELIHRAFEELEGGCDAVLGPAEDGGYYLVALRAAALHPRLFQEITWSTERVLEQSLCRCRERGLRLELLPEAADVDTPEDLKRLAQRLAAGGGAHCPRTSALLRSWGRLAEGASGP